MCMFNNTLDTALEAIHIEVPHIRADLVEFLDQLAVGHERTSFLIGRCFLDDDIMGMGEVHGKKDANREIGTLSTSRQVGAKLARSSFRGIRYYARPCTISA